MPLDRDEILRPLGGEDNLRLMCDAEDFQYTDWDRMLEVTFSTPEFSIDVSYWPDRLSYTNRWSLAVWGKYRVRKIHRSSWILNSELVARTFEWATKCKLSF